MTQTDVNQQCRFLSRQEVMEVTALASCTLAYFVEKGAFPEPCRVNRGVEEWERTKVDGWNDSVRR